MPSTKKRINLTVPDHVYQELQQYKEEYGLESDATACLHLIVRQLKGEQNNKALLHLMRTMSPEQLQELASMGVAATCNELKHKSE